MISLFKKNSRRNRRNRTSIATRPTDINQLSSQSAEKELTRIVNCPRYQMIETDLLGAKLQLVDGKSFYFSFREIFQDRIYEFRPSSDTPLIIDGGSNIGLSIIWFKSIYPNSRVIGFEADPQVFQTLQKNCRSFSLTDVQLRQAAIWDEETELKFEVEGADGGRLAESSCGIGPDKSILKPRTVQVPTVRLKSWLDQTVDLLKLDIEGAEFRVLKDCENNLGNVQNIFVEYHSFAGTPQTLDQILGILIAAGFRVQVHSQFNSPRPLLEQPTQLGMDLQLNIFGFRETNGCGKRLTLDSCQE